MHRLSTRWLALSLVAFFPSACASTDSPSLTGGSGGVAAGAGVGGTGGAGNAGAGGASVSGGTAGSAAGLGPAGGTSGLAGAGGIAGQSGTGGLQAGSAGAAGSGVAAAAGEGGGPAGGAAGSAGSGGAGGLAGMGGAPPAGGSAGAASGAAGSAGGINRPARVLLYSFSTLEIQSVPAQLDILRDELEGWQYEVEESEDPAVFTDDNLSRFAAVGMINTCFSPFGAGQAGTEEAEVLQRFLQEGGGLFGTHCADVTFQSANPVHLYNRLIGGRANSENFMGNSACRTLADHPTSSGLPDTFQYSGNLDNTDFIATDATVLVKCQWSGGAMKDVAVSWTRMEGAGRVFYTNFAKEDVDLTSATLGAPHIIAGLSWVLGR